MATLMFAGGAPAINGRPRGLGLTSRLMIYCCLVMHHLGAVDPGGPDSLIRRSGRSAGVGSQIFSGGLYTGPYFDVFSPTNVTVQSGNTAVLPCRVRQAGNRSVSWVRKSDGHLLSVDEDVFISGGRFQAHRIEASDTWALQIRLVTTNDSADYECQVSTQPKISHLVKLIVVEPVVGIKGAPDMYVKFGSSVTLHCHISGFLQHPAHVTWLFNNSLIASLKSPIPVVHGTVDAPTLSAFSDGNGRSLLLQTTANDSLTSTLTLSSVSVEDSGQYTCAPATAPMASVALHVLIGEHPAAMQHGENGAGIRSSWFSLAVALIQWWCYHILNRP